MLNLDSYTTFPVSLKSQKNFHITQIRNFSSNENSNKINPILPLIEMSVYLREVDSLLNHIYETLDVMDLETTENITLSNGVLRISFKKNKHYVINIQRPNLQVWLSSPFSGPQRFEYNLSEYKWENIRITSSYGIIGFAPHGINYIRKN
jgi:frataxin